MTRAPPVTVIVVRPIVAVPVASVSIAATAAVPITASATVTAATPAFPLQIECVTFTPVFGILDADHSNTTVTWILNESLPPTPIYARETELARPCWHDGIAV